METANVGGGFKKGEVREHMPPLSLSICYDAVSSLCIPSFPLFHISSNQLSNYLLFFLIFFNFPFFQIYIFFFLQIIIFYFSEIYLPKLSMK